MANNYGILKAGDGGNGGRGLDGKGGSDTDDNTAPTRGLVGEFNSKLTEGDKQYASDGGAAGGVSGITQDGGYTLTSAAGSKGARGNDGWGGLNLYSYVRKYTKHTATTYTSKTQFLYYDMFSCATRDNDGEKFGFQGFLDAGYHTNRILLEGDEVTFYFDYDQPFTDNGIFERNCLEADGILFSHNTFKFNVWSITAFGGYCMTQQFNNGTEFKIYCTRGFTTSNCYNYTSSNT